MRIPTAFYKLETSSGLLLFMMTVVAVCIANSPFRVAYQHLLHFPASLGIGSMRLQQPLLDWINDGLMALYFLLIGLEIKREIHRGVLSDKTTLAVPAITALCGLLVPALIFTAFNAYNPLYLQGWAIPTATDIAFTLGIVSLLGSRVPLALKVLLTAIAIFDDIAAIAIIAVFYTESLSWISLATALLLILSLVALNRMDCKRTELFMLTGFLLWIAVLHSGVHATLAGIIVAMAIPDKGSPSMLSHLENRLHPWSAFLILPLFAFANAGVTVLGLTKALLTHSIVLGIALGLFLGKQIGIFLSLSYFIKWKHFLKTEPITLQQIYGISLICGVGFTMSLFIGTLAYQHNDASLMPLVKIGVMLGSLTAGTLGFFVLRKNS